MPNYVEAPQGAPFYTSTIPEGNPQESLTDYHKSLIQRVLAASAQTGSYFKDYLINWEDDYKPPKADWNKKLVAEQPLRVLTDLITLIENFEELNPNQRY